MRLSDYKDEKAIEITAKLLVPVANIAQNAKNVKAKGKGVIAFASAMLENSPKDVMNMLAILNDVPVEEYHCTIATILKDLLEILNDPELKALFQ